MVMSPLLRRAVLDGQSKRSALLDGENKWEDGIVPYELSSNLSNSLIQSFFAVFLLLTSSAYYFNAVFLSHFLCFFKIICDFKT